MKIMLQFRKMIGEKFAFARGRRIDLVLLLAVIFVSCDPAQSLIIANKTDSIATIQLIFKEGSSHYMFDEYTDSDTLLIELDPAKDHMVQEYHFGIGTWKIQGSLDSLAGMFETIEIESKKSKEIFSGTEQIRTFLENGISGRYKELIEIIVE